MDIKNIALVRATDVIPLEGIVKPLSEDNHLTKDHGTEFYYQMNYLLEKYGKLNNTEGNNIEQYMPYTAEYNSMVLWALNGLVPDDMNNTFSNKKCAIIDGLEEQMKQAELISLVPTDTAIKGTVKLSNNAIIWINKEKYEQLSPEEKKKLENTGLSVQISDDSIFDAVNKILSESERYTSEILSLRREDKGFKKSDTSEEVRTTVADIARKNNIAQVLHRNVITQQNDELDKLQSVKNEYRNFNIVSTFYQKSFFKYLFSKIDIDKKLRINIIAYPDTPAYIEKLCDEIEKIGIDRYKEILDEYNNGLEQLKNEGKLPTPQEIVNADKEDKKIDIGLLIKETQKTKSSQVTMKELVTNALMKQNISIEDLRRIDGIEQGKGEKSTNEGVSLDDD